jgi:hypothetical protein
MQIYFIVLIQRKRGKVYFMDGMMVAILIFGCFACYVLVGPVHTSGPAQNSGGKKNSERSDYNPLDKLEACEPFDTETSH